MKKNLTKLMMRKNYRDKNNNRIIIKMRMKNEKKWSI